MAKVSARTLERVRDYAVNEPGYTASFAAWDLSRTGAAISEATVRNATLELLRLGIVECIEDDGKRGKVYAYAPITATSPTSRSNVHRLFGELDDARLAGVGAEAQQRGVVVPHTRAQGASGKPGQDRKRQERGVRVKRARQGT